jgi:predicted amidohydrolase
MFLGGDEKDLFTAGPGPAALTIAGWRVGLGICKDTRITEHIEGTLALGLDVYVAGLVHHPHELADQDTRAARMIARGRIPVAFASAAGCVGHAYPQTAGHSSVWAADGAVLARASGKAGEIAAAVLGREGF